MASDLTDFLEAASDREHVWGVWDCCLFPAAWVQDQTGVDAAAPWRGLYDDEDGARAFVQAEGGIVRTMARAARLAGLLRASQPKAGAVGIVRADPEPMGAVCVMPGFWATISPTGGVVVTACRHLVAWEIPHHGSGHPLPCRSR